MAIRRKVSSDISASLVEYVLKQAGLTQESLADALEVSPAFISRVRAKERSFTLEHLTAFAGLLNLPLGAILLAAVPPSKARPETEKIHALTRQAIAQADIAARKIAAARAARAVNAG